MAEFVEIEEEFEDDDEGIQTDNIKNQQTNMPKGPQFGPGATSKKRQEAIKKANKEAERRRRQEQQEQRKFLKEQQQDEKRNQDRQLKEQKRAAQDLITQARSDAISGRIAAYSLGHTLGFPGYVFSSVVDALLIRPSEEKRVEEQKAYQAELGKYQARIEDQRTKQRRQAEDDISNAPIDATVLDPQGFPKPNQKNPAHNPPPPPPGAPPGGGKQGPPPVTPPPVIPPTPPGGSGTPNANSFSQIMGKLAVPAMIITAAIKAGQEINKAISSSMQAVSGTITQTAAGNATQALTQGAKTAQGLADPLGTNIPLNVAVEGFTSLLQINEGILSAAKEQAAFAPQTLVADLNRELANLGKQIEVARRLDDVTSQLINANTKLDMAFAEFRAQLLENIGPAIVVGISKVADGVTLLTKMLELSVDYGKFLPGGIGQIIQLLDVAIQIELAKLDQATSANALDSSDIPSQIADFFNPIGQPPGPIPNP